MMRGDDIYEIVRYIRSKGIMAGIITNGYYLNEEAIKNFNDAGLQDLQISVDNLEIDKEVSKKSLNYYEKRETLELLKRFAKFDVNINSVLGSKIKHPEDALTIAERAVELGLDSSVGVIHDHDGMAIQALSEAHKAIYQEIKKLASPLSFASFSGFQDALVDGKAYEWRCRAGARYLYICEHGNVQWCSQHRCGKPTAIDIPLKDYSWDDFEREYKREKYCAPTCTIQCVRLVGLFDEKREAQVSMKPYTKPGALPKEVIDALVDTE